MSAGAMTTLTSAAHSLPRHADRVAQMSAIALGCSIPLTIALNNIFLGLMLIGWAFGSAMQSKLGAFRYPVAVPGLVIFALLAAGVLYAESALAQSLLHLRKYADLVLIPFCASSVCRSS